MEDKAVQNEDHYLYNFICEKKFCPICGEYGIRWDLHPNDSYKQSTLDQIIGECVKCNLVYCNISRIQIRNIDGEKKFLSPFFGTEIE